MKKIKILFENESVVVLDKPAGVNVFGSDFLTVQKKVGEQKEVKNSIDAYLQKSSKTKNYHIVHRLDKDTSGCLVVAKTEFAFKLLKQQFQDKKVKKEYLAVVWGWPKFETGIINFPIARSKSDFRKKEVVTHSFLDSLFRGEKREAVTRYKLEKKFEKFGEKLSLIKFYPETGRTHQIRVHSKSFGHPIVGDQLYGPRGSRAEKLAKKIFKIKKIRHLLHAEKVSFFSPGNGHLVGVQSPTPKEFKLY